ncbi:MAG: carboxypeptidase-like regulatory domain-containing protein, partial [Tannerella sp.]|nr:carboxypeptidase-like regulatory domain-containing protein [Tannerella sp.]
MRRLISLCMAGWLMAAGLAAQMPVMKVIDGNGAGNSAVTLERMNIEVEIFGNIAVTTMTMDFRNHTNRQLEGELTFPMPEGVTVSGYALDIDGHLRSAVPVPKARATEVFESIEHRNVDPGLLERVEGNNFRTRIYPLESKDIRTVRVSYEESLTPHSDHTMQYRLPLKYPRAIASFSLRVKIYNATRRPRLVEQPDRTFAFEGDGQVYEASLWKDNFRPGNGLTVSLPKEVDIPEAAWQKNTDGSAYFLINAFHESTTEEKTWGNTLGIIWDNSLNGLQRDRAKELDLLGRIISRKQNLTVELGLLNITFRKAKSFSIRNGDWRELKTYLQHVVYDGGTDFSRLAEAELPADEYLFFTGGLSTFGENSVAFTRPVHCIASSSQADYSALKAISLRTGGKTVNLSGASVGDAFRQLTQSGLQFMGVEERSAVSEIYPSLETDVNGYVSVAGIVRQGQRELTLLFGRNGRVEARQKVELPAAASDVDVYRIWAQKKIAELDIEYDKNREDIELLGRQFGLVTRNTSLIVLESAADYAYYNITPPAELLDEYRSLAKSQLEEKEERIGNLFGHAIVMARELKAWWNTDFKPQKRYPTPDVRTSDATPEPPVAVEEMQTEAAVPEGMRRVTGTVIDALSNEPIIGATVAEKGTDNGLATDSDGRFAITVPASAVLQVSFVGFITQEITVRNRTGLRIVLTEYNAKALEEVVVIGLGVRRDAPASQHIDEEEAYEDYDGDAPAAPSSAERKPSGRIVTTRIRSDRNYILRLETAPDPYDAYLNLRETYMNTPAFFFDASQFFYARGENDRGLLVLSSLSCLALENAELFKTLAYKLKEHGEYARELFVAGKVRDWRPMDAQSHRDYALALQDNGRYQEALDCLYGILLMTFPPEAGERVEGIEEILVCEINNLVSRHRSTLSTERIDPKLLVELPVDVRVVINWNKSDTDIDLWVTDPAGEKCYYDHTRTAAGG